MGIFNKLGDAVSKTTSKVQKTVAEKASARQEKARETAVKEAVYIPVFQDLRNSIPPQIENDTFVWERVVGEARVFPLAGKAIQVPKSMDAYNTYRKQFLPVIEKYTERAYQMYQEQIHSFPEFVELFPVIYDENLAYVLQAVLDVLISESIWTVRYEDIAEFYKSSDSAKWIELYELTQNFVLETMEGIKASTHNIAHGAVNVLQKAIVRRELAENDLFQETLHNIVDRRIQTRQENVGLTKEMQAELYKTIAASPAAELLRADFVNFFFILLSYLKAAEHDIWLPDDGDKLEQAESVFQHLTNPNFPKDKRLDAFIEIMQTFPYEPRYLAFMMKQFGETEETIAIRDYFDVALS